MKKNKVGEDSVVVCTTVPPPHRAGLRRCAARLVRDTCRDDTATRFARHLPTGSRFWVAATPGKGAPPRSWSWYEVGTHGATLIPITNRLPLDKGHVACGSVYNRSFTVTDGDSIVLFTGATSDEVAQAYLASNKPRSWSTFRVRPSADPGLGILYVVLPARAPRKRAPLPTFIVTTDAPGGPLAPAGHKVTALDVEHAAASFCSRERIPTGRPVWVLAPGSQDWRVFVSGWISRVKHCLTRHELEHSYAVTMVEPGSQSNIHQSIIDARSHAEAASAFLRSRSTIYPTGTVVWVRPTPGRDRRESWHAFVAGWISGPPVDATEVASKRKRQSATYFVTELDPLYASTPQQRENLLAQGTYASVQRTSSAKAAMVAHVKLFDLHDDVAVNVLTPSGWRMYNSKLGLKSQPMVVVNAPEPSSTRCYVPKRVLYLVTPRDPRALSLERALHFSVAHVADAPKQAAEAYATMVAMGGGSLWVALADLGGHVTWEQFELNKVPVATPTGAVHAAT